MSWSKKHLPSKSTGNSQEAVAPSRHDGKIVHWDVEQKRNETTLILLCIFQFGRLALESVMKSVCGYESPFVPPPVYDKGDFYSGKSWLLCNSVYDKKYLKVPKFSDARNLVVIYLKFKQRSHT